MKFNKFVSSSRRKARRRLYNAPSHIRRKIMGVGLSKKLCQEYGVEKLTLPIHKDDVVKVMTGKYKEEAPAKVVRVRRTKYCLYIDNIQREKANGAQVKVPIAYSNVQIVKLKLDPFRKKLIQERVAKARKAARRQGFKPRGDPKGRKRAAKRAANKKKAKKRTEPKVDLD